MIPLPRPLRFVSLALLGPALAGCGEAIPTARPASPAAPPARPPAILAPSPMSLTPLRGQDAAHLIARFGTPRLDITEGRGRKLQFAGPACVLDAYLYPPAGGRGGAVVTWVDTRQRDGGPIDPARCIAALGRER